MEFLNTIKSAVVETLVGLYDSFVDAFPSMVKFLIILLIGYLLAVVIRSIISKIKYLDKLSEKVRLSELMEKLGMKLKLSKLLGQVIFLMVFLAFFLTACDAAGLTMISEAILSIIYFIPKVVVAMIIFVIGYYIAGMVKTILHNMLSSLGTSAGRILGNLVYGFLLLVITVTAINHLNIDTSLLNSNITLIIGGIVLAFVIAYGLAARGVTENMVSGYFLKKRFKVGDHIVIGEFDGRITRIDSISVTIANEQKEIVIPCKSLVKSAVLVK